METFVDKSNKTNETRSPTPTSTPAFDYQKEWKDRGYPSLDGSDPVLQAQLASSSRSAVVPSRAAARSDATPSVGSRPLPRFTNPANTGAPAANAGLPPAPPTRGFGVIAVELLRYENDNPGTIKKFQSDLSQLQEWTKENLQQEISLGVAKAILNKPDFAAFKGGRTRRGRKRRKTVKKYRFPKRKTHYRKIQRSRRRR